MTPDHLLNIIKDKKSVLAFLIETIQESEKQRDGLMRLSESLTREDPNLTPANLGKCLATVMKVSAKQANALQNLATVALITCQSSSFDADVAHLLNKMGHGKEALQAMMAAKMAGK